jgi:hypothetical protein
MLAWARCEDIGLVKRTKKSRLGRRRPAKLLRCKVARASEAAEKRRQAKPPVPPCLQVAELPWWRGRFRLRFEGSGEFFRSLFSLQRRASAGVSGPVFQGVRMVMKNGSKNLARASRRAVSRVFSTSLFDHTSARLPTRHAWRRAPQRRNGTSVRADGLCFHRSRRIMWSSST